MGAADTILIRISREDKKTLAELAQGLGISVSELMREGALSYAEIRRLEELGPLADAAKQAALEAGAVIDQTMAKAEASNARIDSMLDKLEAVDASLSAN